MVRLIPGHNRARMYEYMVLWAPSSPSHARTQYSASLAAKATKDGGGICCRPESNAVCTRYA